MRRSVSTLLISMLGQRTAGTRRKRCTRGALVVALVGMAALSPMHVTTFADPDSSLPLTTSSIHFGMDGNYLEPTSNGYKTQEGNVDYVFGADGGPDAPMQNIPALSGNAFHDKYLSWPRDSSGPGVQEPISWYQQYHPDWLLYKNDRTTIPIAMGDNIAPLDYTNPAVQQYMINTWIKPALAGGFQGILFDNNLGFNYLGAAGHYDASGNWVQLYSGTFNDPTYANAQVAAFQAIASAVHAAYPSVTLGVNQGVDCNNNIALNEVGQESMDMIVDQEGFTNSGSRGFPYVAQYSTPICPNGKWLTVAQWAEHLGQAGKGLFLINPEPYSVSAYQTDTDSQAQLDLQWSLANYLLVKYAHTYFWWGAWAAQNGYPIVPQHEYLPVQVIGFPTDDFYGNQSVYMRDYTNGLAVVNPDRYSTYTVSFPAGKYVDLYGNPVTSYTFQPHSGLVLLENYPPPATGTPNPTDTPVPTTTPHPTRTPRPTETSTIVPIATATSTDVPTDTPIPTPVTPDPTDTPLPVPTNTAVSNSTNSTFTAIAVEGIDQTLRVKHTGGDWSDLNGVLTAAPTIVQLPGGASLYLVTGTDHAIWERTDTLGWHRLSRFACQDNPGAAINGTTLTVACQGSDGALWAASTIVSGNDLPWSLSAFTSLGQNTDFGPAVSLVNGAVTYFVIGSDHQIWYRTDYSTWQSLYSWCTGHPAADSYGMTTYLACQGSDGALWYATNNGAGWSGFQSLGGTVVNGPGIAASSSGALFVIESSNNVDLQNQVSPTGAAGGWSPIGSHSLNGAAAS